MTNFSVKQGPKKTCFFQSSETFSNSPVIQLKQTETLEEKISEKNLIHQIISDRCYAKNKYEYKFIKFTTIPYFSC